MQVQDGYPIDYVTDYYQALCVPWDPATRLPLQNTSDIYPTPGATISLGGNNFQFQFNYVNFGISVGNYITVGHLEHSVPVLAPIQRHSLLQSSSCASCATCNMPS